MESESPLRKYFKWAELPARKDVYTWKGTTKWGNHDLYPIDPKERTFGMLAYFSLWVTNGVGISTFTLGSAYIAYGLTAGETIGAILVGSCISSLIGFFAARPGMDYHLGYTIMQRPAYGLWGTYIPIFVVFIGGLVFAGIQAYFGGQAAAVIIAAVIPAFHHMPNTLPASAGVTTQNLIGLIVFTVIYFPILWFVRPHQLRKFLYPNFIIMVATFIGLLAWAISSNGGTGSLITSQIELTSSQKAYRMVQCISSVGGTWGGAADRISDWTRFERKRHASTPSMILTLPLTVTICSLMGVLVTTATFEMYKTTIWNPLSLLQYLQEDSYTPAVRAGTFFAGCGFMSSQIFMNMSQNTIPYGMDVAGMFPKYISMRRAGVFLTMCTLIIQPWRFLGQAYIFITVLSCITIFFAASTVIVLSDYWLIRKKLWKVPDLYEPSGIYWFTGGWNLRALAALILGMAPSLPGFFMVCINSEADNAAVKIFQITYFVACPISFITYILLNYFWPPEGLGVKELIPEEEIYNEVIDAVGSEASLDEKDAAVVEASKVSSIHDGTSA